MSTCAVRVGDLQDDLDTFADPDPVARALADDLDAGFVHLFGTYRDLVFSVTLRLSSSRADPDDLTAETFLRAFRALQGYDRPRIEAHLLRVDHAPGRQVHRLRHDLGHDRLAVHSGLGAFSSPYHFNRLISADTGEPPVRMRRRVLLERAAWQLNHGASVTDTAWSAGYESVEGFSRAFSAAFGRAPSRHGEGYWLPAPNGIHFHPPMSLWVSAEEQPMNPLTEQMVSHDLDDTRALLEQAKGLGDDEFRAVLAPGTVVLSWDGPEESIAGVLTNQVLAKEVWLAAIEGDDLPEHDRGATATAAALIERHDAVAPRWLAMVRDLDRRGGWNDRLVDALCEPPESFVMSSVIAHVLTYSAHRRQLVRRLLAQSGHDVDHGDPIMWLRARYGQETRESDTRETETGADR